MSTNIKNKLIKIIAISFITLFIIVTLAVWYIKAKYHVGPVEFIAVNTLVRAFEARMKPSTANIESKYDQHPLPQNLSDAELENTLDLLSKSFFIEHRDKDEIKIEGDMFLTPNLKYAKGSVTWDKVLTKEGDNILKETMNGKEEDDDNDLFKYASSSASYHRDLQITTEDKNIIPYRAEGTATVTLSVKFIKFKFSSHDIGKTISQDEISITLKECKNNFIHLEINGMPIEDKRLICVTYDKKGGRLEHTESMSGPKDMFSKPDQSHNAQETIKYLYLSRGKIASIEVYIPEQTITRQISVIATREPGRLGTSYTECPEAPRYVKDAEKPTYQTIDPGEVIKQTKIRATRNNAIFGFNTPEAEIILPRIDNSRYAEIQFGDPELLDRYGNKIEFDTEQHFDNENFSESIGFINKNSKGIISFAKAIGTIKIKYPTSITTLRFTKANPSMSGANITFNDNLISYSGSRVESLNNLVPDNWSPVRAYDITGRQLRKIPYLGPGSELGSAQLAFWGKVESLEIDVVNKWISLEMPYNLKPSPMFPLNKIGSPKEY